MLTLLLFGLLLGMRHALDADHVAAVASLATRSATRRDTIRLAAAWGLGHTATLMMLGGALAVLDFALPSGVSRALEAGVGLMLVVLGIDVLRRVRRRRIHFHVHVHDSGVRHFHAHVHGPDVVHDTAAHRHVHRQNANGLSSRAMLIGGVHGLAGSAGLTLLSLQTLHSVGTALVYLALFGLGSMLGMVLFSLVLSWPLGWVAHHLERTSQSLELALGGLTIGIGCWVLMAS
jgi:cytochrome c biogenesis protein CcdA